MSLTLISLTLVILVSFRLVRDGDVDALAIHCLKGSQGGVWGKDALGAMARH